MLKRFRSAIASSGPPAKRFKKSENNNDRPAFELNITPELNEYCLLEVFSILSLQELCIVRNVSRQFRVLAEATVKKKWSTGKLKDSVITFNITGEDEETEAMLLKNFGNLVTHLYIDPMESCENLDQLLKLCTSLKYLNLRNVTPEIVPHEIVKNLKELDVHDCAYLNVDDTMIMNLIAACKSLKQLKVIAKPTELLVKAINSHSTIERVHWQVINVTDSMFKHEIKMLYKVKRLKKLSLHGYGGYSFRGKSMAYYFPQVTRTIQYLARNPSIEELFISAFDPDNNFLRSLRKFVNLKRCELQTYVAIAPALLDPLTGYDIEMNSGSNFCQYQYVITKNSKNLLNKTI